MAQLTDTDFELFGLPCAFELDETQLNQAWLKLQNTAHPDRHANATPQEKRIAVQWAARLNEAYKRLSNPTERAVYWCELQGKNPKGQQSQLPAALLMQQMEWREQLQECANMDSLEDLLGEVLAQKKQSLHTVAQQIDQDQNPQAALETTQGLLFVDKFLAEVKRKIEILEDAS